MDGFRRAAQIAARQHGAISHTQARHCGLSRNQIRQAVRSGRWTVARHAVYLYADTPRTWEQRAWIALLACGLGAVLSYRSAAYLHALADDKPHRIDVTVPRRARGAVLDGVVIHRALDLELRDKRTVDGFPVASPARTLVDVASEASDRLLGRALDRALLNGLVTVEVTRAYIRIADYAGVRVSPKLIKLLDNRQFGVPESELERRTIELIADHRLPKPVRQQRVGPHRVDFAYEEQRVVVEADGRATHGTSEAFEADPVRQNELVLQGWTVLRFTWKQITQDADYVADTIRRAVQ